MCVTVCLFFKASVGAWVEVERKQLKRILPCYLRRSRNGAKVVPGWLVVGSAQWGPKGNAPALLVAVLVHHVVSQVSHHHHAVGSGGQPRRAAQACSEINVEEVRSGLQRKHLHLRLRPVNASTQHQVSHTGHASELGPTLGELPQRRAVERPDLEDIGWRVILWKRDGMVGSFSRKLFHVTGAYSVNRDTLVLKPIDRSKKVALHTTSMINHLCHSMEM